MSNSITEQTVTGCEERLREGSLGASAWERWVPAL